MNAQQIRKGAYDAADKYAENPFLRLFGRVAMALALPMMIWIATAFDTLRTNQVEIRTKLEERTSDRYTSVQAARDWQLQARRDELQDTDRARLERRFDGLEQQLRGSK